MRDMSDSARNRRRKHLEELEPGERCKTDRSIFDVPLAPTAAWEQECVESDTGGTRSTRALEERIQSRRQAKITQPITIRGVPPTGSASGLPRELRQEHFERTFWLRRRARASGAPVLPPNEGGIEYAPASRNWFCLRHRMARIVMDQMVVCQQVPSGVHRCRLSRATRFRECAAQRSGARRAAPPARYPWSQCGFAPLIRQQTTVKGRVEKDTPRPRQIRVQCHRSAEIRISLVLESIRGSERRRTRRVAASSPRTRTPTARQFRCRAPSTLVLSNSRRGVCHRRPSCRCFLQRNRRRLLSASEL
jgi:hypothetical protein